MAERKLDIFELLHATDNHDTEWLSKQPEDAQKEFVPVTAARWASCVEGNLEAVYMLWMINERVNVHLYEIAKKHPELIYKLIASCGLNKSMRHQWIPMQKKGSNNKALQFLESLYPDANDFEIRMLISRYDKKGFSQLLENCGVSPNDAKELKKAYGNLRL